MPEMKKILVAEDEKPMAKALALKLQKEGFEAEVANDGNEVLEKMASGEYHLLVLDLVMPEKDGWAVLEELKQKGNTVPILVASNLSQESDRKRAMELGAVDFFIKSNVSLSEIVKHCTEALKE